MSTFDRRALDSTLEIVGTEIARRIRKAFEDTPLPVRSDVKVRGISTVEAIQLPERRAYTVRVIVDLDVTPRFA